MVIAVSRTGYFNGKAEGRLASPEMGKSEEG